MNISTPTPLLTQRTITWDEANAIRKNYRSGDIELCSTEIYAFGGLFKKGGQFLVLIDVRDDSEWELSIDNDSNILTATKPSLT